MIDIASPILQWLNNHPELAGLAIFIISAAESVAIIGTIVPGSVMMTAIGALVGASIIPFWSTLLYAILGAIVGDSISYWVGHHFKSRLHQVWPFRKHPNILARGQSFFDAHGAKSVFIGRFVGPVRALVPLIAGMLGVKPLRFTIANIASAIGWAPAYLLPGILLGAASVELPSEVTARVILMFILTTLFIILCLWLIKKSFNLIQNQVDRILTDLWHTLKESRYFHIVTAVLKHHDSSKPYGQLTLGFYFVLTLITFIYLSTLVIYTGPQNIYINNVVYHLCRSLRTPGADHVMLYISFLGEKFVLLPLSLTLFVWFAISKRMHTAWHVLGLGILAAGGIELAKVFLHSPRPWGIVDGNYGSKYSFPSGHTVLAIMYYFSLALLIIKTYRLKQSRQMVYLIAGILVTIICISRLYLGVHWATDIIGSSILGAALLMLVILSYNRKAEKPLKPKGFIITTILTLLITYPVSVHFTYDKFLDSYTMLSWPSREVTFEDWWFQKGDHFPLHRVNRLGLPVKIFNLQWSNDLETIKTQLLKNGWEEVPKHDWLRVMYRIAGVRSTEHLPLVSPTYLDNAPVFVVTKRMPDSNKLLVLRIWKPYITINNLDKPIWMASVEYAPSTYSWLFKHKHDTEVPLTPSLIFNSIPKQDDIKEITFTTKEKKKHVTQTIILIKGK